MWTPRTVWAWSDTLRSCLTTPWRCTGTPWSLPLKLILPFNVFPLISGETHGWKVTQYILIFWHSISAHKKELKVFHYTYKLTRSKIPDLMLVSSRLTEVILKSKYSATKELRGSCGTRREELRSVVWLPAGNEDWTRCIMNLLKSKEGQFYWAGMTGKMIAQCFWLLKVFVC